MRTLIYYTRQFSEEIAEQPVENKSTAVPKLSYRDKRLLNKYNKLSDKISTGEEGYTSKANQSLLKVTKRVASAPKSIARKAAIATGALAGPGMAYALYKSPLLKSKERSDRVSDKLVNSKYGSKLSSKLAKRKLEKDQQKLTRLSNKLVERGVKHNTVEIQS